MKDTIELEVCVSDPARVAAREAIFPRAFFTAHPPTAVEAYLNDPSAQKLIQFFQDKGLAALKDEDLRAQWYDDWLAYQASHNLYANLLAPRHYSTMGAELNLLRLTRFFECFGYCSPAHGYSLQVSFLGLFSILMGTNAALKQEAVAALERGGLFAFGVSEKNHGSDLLANQFVVREEASGNLVANGAKYYIGNANCASMISILARKVGPRTVGRVHRAPLVLFALRPASSDSFQKLRKIPTLGVRAAFVGEFEVRDHPLAESDVIAEGRKAWDAVFGTVSLGKFFLGFGQIGICERAWEEADTHLRSRVLYGNPAIAMPHLRSAMAEAYVRLTAMKLYAYRALDYVQCANAADRRYLLFTAVQKAKVSTEGVKVMALLSECVGAKGFETDTYFEMALRDAQLIPGLEGSAHVNLSLAAQFIPAYFGSFDSSLAVPNSTFAGQIAAIENPYLMEASMHGMHGIRFRDFLQCYRPLMSMPNVRIFVKQAKAYSLFLRRARFKELSADTEVTIAMGACLATIAYGQLLAENSALLGVPGPIISAAFHLLVRDLSIAALSLATLPQLNAAERTRIRQIIVVPEMRGADWSFVAERMSRISGDVGR